MCFLVGQQLCLHLPLAAAWLCDPADCPLNLSGSPCLEAMSPSQHLNLAGWKRFRHCPAMCCHSQLSSLRDSKEVFGPGVNFWGHHKSGEDIWKLTQLKSEVLFWLSTCLVCSSLTLPACIWSVTNSKSCSAGHISPRFTCNYDQNLLLNSRLL